MSIPISKSSSDDSEDIPRRLTLPGLDFRGLGNRGSERIFLDIPRRLALPGLNFRGLGNRGSERIFLDIPRRLALPGLDFRGLGNRGSERFPKIPEELNFYISPSPLLDQNNENLDIIDALDGIDGVNGSKDLPCDYPSHISGGILASKLADINDEGEVNSGTSVVKIPENEQGAPVTPSLLSLIVVPTSNINNRGIAPICSSMSGLPFGVTEETSLLKDVFREAMTKYLKKSFTDVIKHGFSNLRTWWDKSNQRLQNLITESFQADPAPLTRRMEVFLKRVDAYLFKRKQILECPTLEERDQQLESLNSRIDVEMAIFSSLESKIGQLASELDKLRDELKTRNKMEDARITLEQAQVRNVANVKSIDQERKTLEYNFLQLVESD
ncbi:hypothetical protein Adt_46352 [Abeliophyllum distichum]|uniref:Uncharacterized protein n=1 Tax=Abeliophyllum distichum TaxID=126358 RepID=A0ABD1P1H1_9LAMI